jgi:uncharacterized membrane protein YeaQ/YmgE (transglycosylase-associated protein family)
MHCISAFQPNPNDFRVRFKTLVAFIHNTQFKETFMNILYTLMIGLVVGFIARAVMPGEQKLGWIMTAVLGVSGSFIATFAGQALGMYQAGDTPGWIASVIGAVILLIIYGLVQKKS